MERPSPHCGGETIVQKKEVSKSTGLDGDYNMSIRRIGPALTSIQALLVDTLDRRGAGSAVIREALEGVIAKINFTNGRAAMLADHCQKVETQSTNLWERLSPEQQKEIAELYYGTLDTFRTRSVEALDSSLRFLQRGRRMDTETIVSRAEELRQFSDQAFADLWNTALQLKAKMEQFDQNISLERKESNERGIYG